MQKENNQHNNNQNNRKDDNQHNQQKQEQKQEQEQEQKIKQDSNIENIFDENNDKWQEIKQNTKTIEQILQEEVEKNNDQILRAKAEIENLKRRTDKEKKDIAKYAITNFAREILNVADNITRALKSINQNEKDNATESVKNLIIGIEMTEKELYKTLENNGIKKIKAIGQKFDPNFHQAFFKVKTEKYQEGHIAQIINEGFTINDRVLRPSMVAIAENQQDEKINEINLTEQNNNKNTKQDNQPKNQKQQSKQIYDKKITEDNKKNISGCKIDKNA